MKERNHSQSNNIKNLAYSLIALDFLCLFVAPIAGGAGNYMALFFSSNLHWGPAKVGIILAILSVSLGMAQIPAGVLIDKVPRLRQIIIGALAALIVGWLSILIYPDFYIAIAAQILIGCSCAIFMPAIASMSLGLVGLKNFDIRLGRNGVFSHAGNVVTAIFVAICISVATTRAVLILFVVFAVLSILAILEINDKCINYAHLHKRHNNHAVVHPLLGGFASLTKSRTSIFFTLAALFYTFADASMLPLMVQRIAKIGTKTSSIHVPIALFLTESIMIPVSYWAGRRARLGRKPLLLISYIFLFIRGFSFSFVNDPNMFVALQILDGISAGMFGLMLTLVISDLSIDTGRFNATLTTMGMLFTLTNGASSLIFGVVAGKLGFTLAFDVMAVCAVLGGLMIWALVPETVQEAEPEFA